MPAHRQQLGSFAALPDLRPRRVLRRLPWAACKASCPPRVSSRYRFLRTRRALGLVLRGRRYGRLAGRSNAIPSLETLPGRYAFPVPRLLVLETTAVGSGTFHSPMRESVRAPVFAAASIPQGCQTVAGGGHRRAEVVGSDTPGWLAPTGQPSSAQGI